MLNRNGRSSDSCEPSQCESSVKRAERTPQEFMCFLLLNVQLCSLDKVHADKLNLLYVLNGANHSSDVIRANVL